ncbi:MAG: hypothetical protein WBE58_00875, partial [Verrucomicrobiales bacterium]
MGFYFRDFGKIPVDFDRISSTRTVRLFPAAEKSDPDFCFVIPPFIQRAHNPTWQSPEILS